MFGLRRGFQWILFLAFLALSVVLTILLWPYGAFLFLVFPFFWFPRSWSRSRSAPERRCPRCGWSTPESEAHFCPRDGTRLESS